LKFSLYLLKEWGHSARDDCLHTGCHTSEPETQNQTNKKRTLARVQNKTHAHLRHLKMTLLKKKKKFNKI